MAIQVRQESYSKEIDDIMVLVVNVVKKIKAGTPIGEVIGGEIQDLMNAIAGSEGVGAELKDLDVALRTVMARAGELAATLVTPKPILPIVHPVVPV